jgi:hypothetical protein
MNKKEERAVLITFKTLNKDGEYDQLSISELKPRLAKRVYKKLLYRWKHYKVVDIPLFAIAVAADDINNIAIL